MQEGDDGKRRTHLHSASPRRVQVVDAGIHGSFSVHACGVFSRTRHSGSADDLTTLNRPRGITKGLLKGRGELN